MPINENELQQMEPLHDLRSNRLSRPFIRALVRYFNEIGGWTKSYAYVQASNSSNVDTVLTLASTYYELGDDGAGGNNCAMETVTSSEFTSDGASGLTYNGKKRKRFIVRWEMSCRKQPSGATEFSYTLRPHKEGSVTGRDHIIDLSSSWKNFVITDHVVLTEGQTIDLRVSEGTPTDFRHQGLRIMVYEANVNA